MHWVPRRRRPYAREVRPDKELRVGLGALVGASLFRHGAGSGDGYGSCQQHQRAAANSGGRHGGDVVRQGYCLRGQAGVTGSKTGLDPVCQRLKFAWRCRCSAFAVSSENEVSRETPPTSIVAWREGRSGAGTLRRLRRPPCLPIGGLDCGW